MRVLSRTEKFPSPLMRFLRSHVGSKSRARNRTNYPLFLRRNKKAITSSSSSSTAIEATQEPSSPKVTCIGQVRVRRSKSKTTSSSDPSSFKKNPRKKCIQNCCYCLEKPSFLCNSSKQWKPNIKKWVLFFNCPSVKVRTDSSNFGSNRFEQAEENEETTMQNEEREKWSLSCMEEVTSTTTPPKNALLLTRCRSAPYRSSSLACQFWGSPLRHTEDDEETQAQNTEEQRNRALGIERRDSTSNSRGDQNSQSSGRPSSCSSGSKKEDLGICTHVEINKEDCLNEVKKRGEIIITPTRAVDNAEGAFARPLMLMRCKSEPTRRDLEKLDPESSEFWRHRRLDKTQSSTPH